MASLQHRRKRTAFYAWVVVGVVVLLGVLSNLLRKPDAIHSSTAGASRFSPTQVESGRTLHEQILRRYRSLDASYRMALLHGALTKEPRAIICVPEAAWHALSTSEQDDLRAYAASCMRAAGADRWGIMIGAITADGRDILSDSIVARGR